MLFPRGSRLYVFYNSKLLQFGGKVSVKTSESKCNKCDRHLGWSWPPAPRLVFCHGLIQLLGAMFFGYKHGNAKAERQSHHTHQRPDHAARGLVCGRVLSAVFHGARRFHRLKCFQMNGHGPCTGTASSLRAPPPGNGRSCVAEAVKGSSIQVTANPRGLHRPGGL